MIVKVEFLDLRAYNLKENIATLNTEAIDAETIDNSNEIGTVVEDELGQFSIIYPSNISVQNKNSSSEIVSSGNNKELLSADQEKCNEEPQKFNCKKCNRNFRSLKSLRQHKKLVHPRNLPYACKICQSFKSDKKLELLKHLKTHENKNKSVRKLGRNSFV